MEIRNRPLSEVPAKVPVQLSPEEILHQKRMEEVFGPAKPGDAKDPFEGKDVSKIDKWIAERLKNPFKKK